MQTSSKVTFTLQRKGEPFIARLCSILSRQIGGKPHETANVEALCMQLQIASKT